MYKVMEIDGSKFSWGKDPTGGMIGCAEISSLQLNQAPKTFVVKSHKTGQSRQFIIMGVETDVDNDVIQWTYISPGNGLTIGIFND